MRPHSFLIGCLPLLTWCGPLAIAASQTLPLDAKGSTLTFVGDAFLHTFHGEAKDFAGNATLDADATPPVQKATLHFKTAALTTFNDKRDQNMRDWMKIEVHPEVTFTLESVKLVDGDIQKADVQHPAHFAVDGTLSMSGAKQAINGTALGWREGNHLFVSGDTVVDTLKFGLPQIRQGIMTVGTKVKTSYRFVFTLPPAYALNVTK